MMEGFVCECVYLYVSALRGNPSTSHRARYGSVGMRKRAGRLTRSNTGGGGPNQYGTETAYSTRRESQDCVFVCLCMCVCVCVYLCVWNPWPLIIPTGSVRLHPSLDLQWYNTHTRMHYSSSCLSLFYSPRDICILFLWGYLARIAHWCGEGRSGPNVDLLLAPGFHSGKLCMCVFVCVCACEWVSA